MTSGDDAPPGGQPPRFLRDVDKARDPKWVSCPENHTPNRRSERSPCHGRDQRPQGVEYNRVANTSQPSAGHPRMSGPPSIFLSLPDGRGGTKETRLYSVVGGGSCQGPNRRAGLDTKSSGIVYAPLDVPKRLIDLVD